jgi:hypothetical protein
MLMTKSMRFRTGRTFGSGGGFWCPILLLSLKVFACTAQAAVIRAESLSLADVARAINIAADGDTLLLPAGRATWTDAITVNKGISIIGAGQDATVITASISGRSDRRTFTIFASARQPMFRLSGLTIQGVTGERVRGPNGVIHMFGDAHRFRIDHVKITELEDSLIIFDGYLWGVVDHCNFETIGTANVVIGHSTWPGPDGGPANNGNGSWADDPYWGTDKFIFIEDCTFTGASPFAIDANNGGRYVFRRNFTVGLIGGHGTESTLQARGTRAAEIYDNVSDAGASTNSSLKDKPIVVRSGARLIFNNVFKNWNHPAAINYFRGHNVFRLWGGANGTNAWDDADPRVYASGTVTRASSGSTVVLPLSGVAANQYEGYVLRNTSAGSSLRFSTIMRNTASRADRVTFSYMRSAGLGQRTMRFAAGDHFEIRKVLAGLDAPGRGRGDLLTGRLTTIYNTVTGRRSWPHNALEGIYFWNNHNDSPSGPLATFSYQGIPAIEGGLFTTPKPDYMPFPYPHPLTF